MARLQEMIVDDDLTVTGNIYNDSNSSLSDKISNKIEKMKNILCEDYVLDVTTVAGTNYTVNDASVVIVGNKLRVYIYVTRSSAINGNITNETAVKLTVNGDKIGNLYNSTAISHNIGHCTSFCTNNIKRNANNTISFNVNITATAGSNTSMNTYFYMPMIPNPDGY